MKVLRKRKSLIWLAGVMLGALLIAGCGSGTESADNTVAATVNGKKIMLQEVERVIQQQTSGKQANLSPLELAQARLQVFLRRYNRQSCSILRGM